MNNPYIVLGISQDATKVDIVKAQVKALRLKKNSPREVAAAQKELHSPARRLAVDFTYPVFKGLESTTTKSKEVDLDTLNLDKYKS